jgi:hypothetical protein
MAKYKDGRASIKERKNQTIHTPKPNSLVPLSQASTFVMRSSSNKRSRTPPWQNLVGCDHHQWDYHPAPYFSVMYLSCPPWAGWYRPWMPPPMHFHLEWLVPARGFDHRGYYIEDGHYRSISRQKDRSGPRQENRMVSFCQRR